MIVCTKYVLSFVLSVLFNNEPVYGHPEVTSRQINGLQAVRFKRQTGYVYDRPSISFDLPSRNSIVSTSTQAPPVDRISMQMYYAYPAPADQSAVNIGFTSTGSVPTSTGSSGSTGYNVQSSSTGNVASGGTSGSSGYNYAVPNTQAQNIQIGDATVGNNLSGYNYGVQNTVVENTQVGSVRDISTSDNSGLSGYSYGVQNTEQINTGQNTVIQNTQSGLNTNAVSDKTGTTGYSYGVQNNAVSNVGSEITTNTGRSGYTQTSTQGVRVSTGGVSTNAPRYLPPSNTDVVSVTNAPVNVQTGSTAAVSIPSDTYIPASVSSVTVQNTPAVTVSQSGSNAPSVNSINVQTGSTATISAPSDTYLPPSVNSVTVQSTPAVTVTQSGSNAPPVNIVNQSSNTPNPGYLVPNTVSVTSRTPVRQTQTVATVRQPQQVLAQTYLPPVVSQVSVSTPAPSYLPPVF